MLNLNFFFVLLFMLPGLSIQAQTIDQLNSVVNFSISNFGANTVNGTISGMSGSIQFTPTDLTNASFNVCIDPNTISTGIDLRNKHLKESGYFDIASFPAICFVASTITKTDTGFSAKGVLTIRGISKSIELPFTFSNHTFTGDLSLDRTDFKIGKNGGFLIGKTATIKITCIVQ